MQYSTVPLQTFGRHDYYLGQNVLLDQNSPALLRIIGDTTKGGVRDELS